MKRKGSCFDVVVIGAGPAGLFAGLELAKKRINTLIIERTSQIGDIALRFGVNLDYCYGLPTKSNLGKQVFGSRRLANSLINYVYKLLIEHGLPVPKELLSSGGSKRVFEIDGLDYIDPGIWPVDRSMVRIILKNIRKELNTAKALKISFGVEVQHIQKGEKRSWRVTVKDKAGLYNVEADNVIIATGKLSGGWLMEILDSIGIYYQNNPKIDIGVRIEGPADSFKKITNECLNPKIIIKSKNTQARTFCWCVGGRVISYDFHGAKILDGQHLHNRSTPNTNFGILATLQLPLYVSNTEFGIWFAKFMNSLGAGLPLLQRFGDLVKDKETSPSSLKTNSVKPTLSHFSLVNMRKYLPPLVVSGVIEMINKISDVLPSATVEDWLIYAPVVERIFPNIKLSYQMETNKKGIFLIGDCSGKISGVISGTASGIVAVRYIAKSCKRKK